jgi:histidinol-phosphate aminotransferase
MTSLSRLRPAVVSSSAAFSFDYAGASPELARLDCNECYLEPDEEERVYLARAFSDVVLNRYPDVSAAPLRRAYARYLGVQPDEVLVTNGSVEAIGILVEGFCVAASDAAPMLIAEPTFPLFRIIADHHGVACVGVPLQGDFSLDGDAMLQVITDTRPSLTVVVSPNNPTGNRLDGRVIERLIETTDGALVVDEAYAEFDGRSFVNRARSTPGLFVMRSLSKVGFAGLRIGALVGHARAIAELDKVRIPWNVDAVAVALGTCVLQRPDKLQARVRAVVGARDEFAQELAKLPGVTVYPSNANFLLVRVAAEPARVAQELLAHDVLVRNVAAPGLLSNCLRISVGSPRENQRCVSAIRTAMGQR